MEEKCHICDEETEYYCRDCDKPVCEECCAVPTYHRMIDYTLCTECELSREVSEIKEREKEWKIEEERKVKKEKGAKTRRATYWKPENVAKRKDKKEALLIARREADEKRAKEVAKVIGSMFKGMF